jgi:dTDP-4-amino-4,6-dideoxygalactose transaminase
VLKDALAILGGRPCVTAATEFSWPPIGDADIASVVALLRRGEISYYGREGAVEALEAGFCDYVGAGHALACSSGTAALHSAYFALDLRRGDEVIAPTFTFLSTVMPLFVCNAVPVLVDCEPDTGNIDPAAIEAAITPRTRAIVVVHINGHVCDMDPIVEIARRRGLRLVEDCSHAHGATYRGAPVGSFGDVSVFSLQGSKLVSAGQGGILTCNEDEIFERAVMLGHFRARAFDDVHMEAYRAFAATGYGLNYRMHPLAAALALNQFSQLDRYIEGRNDNLGRLSAGLAQIAGVAPPTPKAYATRHPFYNYKPLYDAAALGGLDRRLYIAALKAEGVPVEDSTSLPLHCEALFQTRDDLSGTYGGEPNRRCYRNGDLPNAEAYAERALRIPSYTEPRTGLIDQIVEAFGKVARNVDALHDMARSQAAAARRAEHEDAGAAVIARR